VFSFTSRPLYPQGNSPCYPLDGRLGGPQSRSGRGGEEKNSQPPPGIESYNPKRPDRSLVTIPSELTRLSDVGIDENNIKKCTLKIGCENVDWIRLGQGRLQWRALVKTLMKLLLP
jgi:hypothetical protein